VQQAYALLVIRAEFWSENWHEKTPHTRDEGADWCIMLKWILKQLC